MISFFGWNPSPPCVFFAIFSVSPPKLVKIAITEAVVVTVEALVLGRLDEVVHVTAKSF